MAGAVPGEPNAPARAGMNHTTAAARRTCRGPRAGGDEPFRDFVKAQYPERWPRAGGDELTGNYKDVTMKPQRVRRRLNRERMSALRDRMRALHRQEQKTEHGHWPRTEEIFQRAAQGNGVTMLDMSRIWVTEGNNPACGTRGCAIGVTITMFPEETRAAHSQREKNGNYATMTDAAADVLGLNEAQASALFDGPVTDETQEATLEKMTGAEVAAAIDRLLNGSAPNHIWE